MQSKFLDLSLTFIKSFQISRLFPVFQVYTNLKKATAITLQVGLVFILNVKLIFQLYKCSKIDNMVNNRSVLEELSKIHKTKSTSKIPSKLKMIY